MSYQKVVIILFVIQCVCYIRFDTDQTKEEPLLQVIFSQPMLQDLKKLESSQSSQMSGITPLSKAETVEKLPDSDQDDRGE